MSSAQNKKSVFVSVIEFPFHPLFLAAYSFAHLYSVNAALGLTLERLLKPCAITFVCVLAGWLILTAILRSLKNAAVLASAGVFIFSSAGHIHGLISKAVPFPYWGIIVLFSAGWAALAVLIFRKRVQPEKWTLNLNLITAFLLLMPIFSLAASGTQNKNNALPAPAKAASAAPLARRPLTPAQMKMPDVYYIILDEYARNDVIKKVFNYDNSGFTDALKKIGFYIAEDSHCNYMRTTLSLPSSLNMQYLDNIPKQVGETSKNTAIPFAMVRSNRVANTFKSLGYQYVMTDSGVPPIDTSPIADKLFSYTGTDEFTALLAKRTMGKGAAEFIHNQQRQRHLFNFQHIETIPEIEGPTFAFLHFNMPHPPFVFDRDGNPSKAESYDIKPDEYGPEYEKFYLDQLIYTNKVVLGLIGKILAKSEKPPIIIIQSDHGLTPSMPWENSEEFVKQRGPILNAYLVPPPMQKKLYPSISPVNTFRLLFKTLFGAPVDLTEDRLYYSHAKDHPYRFTDVTARLDKKTGA